MVCVKSDNKEFFFLGGKINIILLLIIKNKVVVKLYKRIAFIQNSMMMQRKLVSQLSKRGVLEDLQSKNTL